MSNPTPGDMHVNAPLTNISVAFIQNAANFVATQVFPRVPVNFQSNLYYKYTRADWNRSEAKPRAPGEESAGSGWTLTTDNYFCNVTAVHKDISDQDYANADATFNLDSDAAEWTGQQMLISQDQQWAASYFGTSIWTGDQTGVSATPSTNQFLQWNDANSTPIKDVRAQAAAIALRSGGYKPNVLVLGPLVYNQLLDHPTILDRIKYTQTGIVSTGLLASLFDVDRVVVPWAVINTAAEGAAESNSFNYGKSALLAYAAPNAGLRTPSAGYTFSWAGLLGAADGVRIKRFEIPEIASTRVEGEIAVNMKVVAPEMATFFASAVA